MLNRDEFISLKQQVLVKRFSNMNPMQAEAVFKVNGPLLILAGAGSGKTTVIINRIAYMIKFGDAYHSTYFDDNANIEILKGDTSKDKTILIRTADENKRNEIITRLTK